MPQAGHLRLPMPLCPKSRNICRRRRCFFLPGVCERGAVVGVFEQVEAGDVDVAESVSAVRFMLVTKLRLQAVFSWLETRMAAWAAETLGARRLARRREYFFIN